MLAAINYIDVAFLVITFFVCFWGVIVVAILVGELR